MAVIFPDRVPNGGIFFSGRVTMGMTTLLTLASMFGSLTSITPPISYYTKLDIWMLSCMVFVFLTLAEFTLVIILKYYLPHLPLDWFHKLCLKARANPPSLAASINQKGQKANKDALARTKAWVSTDSNVRLRAVATIQDYSHKPKHALNGKGPLEKDTTELFDDDETESIPEEVLLDERKQMSEKVIKAIDKYSVIIFLLSFSIFVGFYWYRLLKHLNNR